MAKPTANTFFAASSSTNKTKIQAALDGIAAGDHRDKVLSNLNGITGQLGGAERDQLVSMVYQQLSER